MDSDAYAKHNKKEVGAPVGYYKHPDSKEELRADSFPQADAYTRQGWEYSRPLESAVEKQSNEKKDTK